MKGQLEFVLKRCVCVRACVWEGGVGQACI